MKIKLCTLAILAVFATPTLSFADGRWDRGNHWKERPYYSYDNDRRHHDYGDNSRRRDRDNDHDDWRKGWTEHRDRYDNYVTHYRFPEPREPGFGLNRFGQDSGLIQQGVRSGRLTDRELADLRKEEANIHQEQARYMADGVLTSRERRDLYKDQQAFEKGLNHNLNDGERRW